MKTNCPHCPFFPIFIAIVGFWGATAARAAIVDTYDGTYAATATQGNTAPGPEIRPGGPNGNFLHLVDAVGSQVNYYAYDQPATEAGAFDTVRATFDFRITPGTAGLADGFHFLLLPTATFGTSGVGSNVLAEEPNVPGAFAIGVDVYPGINNISAHWDNAQRIEHAVPAFGGISFRDNGVFNRAQIDLQRVGNGTNAIVTLTEDSLGVPGTPYKAFEVAIPNMLPYDNRVQFGGRTGGENMNVDIDNLNVTSSNPFTPLAIAPAGHLYQDFDRAGTTGYRAVQNAPRTATLFRPGPLLTAADPGSSGAFLRLVPDALAGASNHAAFDRGVDGGASNTMTERVRFDVRFSDAATPANPADGLGVLFLPTSTLGTAGDGIASSEEPNHAGILAIGFDVYTNDATDPAPAISVHWDGVEVADQAITDPAFALNQFHRIEVIRQPVDGGINLTVLGIGNINGGGTTQVPLISNLFVAGATNYDYRMQFSARTGGADAAHDIDNIVASQQTSPRLANTQTTFTNAQGSAWKGYSISGNAAPDVKNEGGTNGDFLRLARDGVASQQNAIAFDQQLNGVAAGINGVISNFDFRIVNDPAAGPADGFCFMLIPTATFGTTGPGVLGSIAGFIAEEPNVTGVFGLAFDIYNGAGVLWNEASLHWNGAPIAELDIDPALIDLDSGLFHHARLVLTKSGSDVLADLILTPDVFGVPGAPVTVFDDILLPGMAFYDYRVEFGARTGGLDASFDLDNILVQVPEPSTAVLLMAGVSGLFAGRRRARLQPGSSRGPCLESAN